MKDGFIKVAAITPAIKVADCAHNAKAIIDAISRAVADGVKLAVFPELSVCGYTVGDLLLQDTLLDGCAKAISDIAAATAKCDIVAVVGSPIVKSNKLYDCAVVINRGKVIGVCPKSNIPNYGEFYELRHFTPYDSQVADTVMLNYGAGEIEVPFGYLLFRCAGKRNFCFATEVCEDLWSPCSPSALLCSAGANIIVNPSASDEIIGKSDYRRNLIAVQSGKLACGYVYCDAGEGESVTDLVFAGHNIAAECGAIIAESAPFDSGYLVTEIDVDKIAHERRRINTFGVASGITEVSFESDVSKTVLTRRIDATPFVPKDGGELQSRCEEVLEIQARALAARLKHVGGKSVIGISGGLDSALALIVAVKATDLIGGKRSDITAVTMPCYGTTSRTKSNASLLSEALGVNFSEVDIKASVDRHLKDIGHDMQSTDVTYENAQARERTQVLMDIANKTGAIVVGTGDLSELALGWATYNGDHMSMYGVNAGVPKTLVRHLVRHYAYSCGSKQAADALYDILDTPVSPELLPAKDGKISQCTEEIVGPYELHDFFLYNILRWGFSPLKVYRLACEAFSDYKPAVIARWLKTFCSRFFAQQFKRSCMPDGPKVGSVTLSPRGDLRMPSDAHAALWIKQLESIGGAKGKKAQSDAQDSKKQSPKRQ
ncbi:MAG: NAD(+) synthase [Clostridia bacterium]|nr:NAD(+) synthase [Clostridia bacterium]